ncbi:MAG: right-handed parallel beta-helix repeat-containing protein [bacterium]
MMERFLLAAVAVLAGIGFVDAAAGTHRVPSEYPTIQAGLDVAAPGDTVLVAPGRYTDAEKRMYVGTPLWSCGHLPDGVTLLSEQGPELTSIDMDGIDGPQACVLIAWEAKHPIRIEGFTLTGTAGIGGLGFYSILNQHVVVERCIFRELETDFKGAAIVIDGAGAVIDCTFEDCHTTSAGGAIAQEGGHIDLIRCVVRRCGDRAVYLADSPDLRRASSYIEGCLFEDNETDTPGGALTIASHFDGGIVRNCVFRNNVANGPGGALIWSGFGEKLVESCLFLNNAAVSSNGQGGAIAVSGNGPCTIRGNTFFGNRQAFQNPGFGGAAVRLGVPAVFENNIVAMSEGNLAITAPDTWSPSCNLYWGNEVGIGVELSPTDRVADPLFCDVAQGDFTVAANSPCVDPQSEGCGQIGAYGIGCEPMSVESETWARIKTRYRRAAGR